MTNIMKQSVTLCLYLLFSFLAVELNATENLAYPEAARTHAGTTGAFLLPEIAPVTETAEPGHSRNTMVIELVSESGRQHDTKLLLEVCKKYGLSASNIYQWHNHAVIYGPVKNPYAIRKDLLARFKHDYVKIYHAPFYEFKRSKHCAGATTEKEWDNIILTASLVQDSTLQKEYLDYHATQFEEWPEVARGFCNASFQQLQLFKYGRQLMLIISIPKGASLEELDPKTAENNPRVDDWNNLMKKYQEGIPDAAPGETWVFLKPLSGR
ncbi:L-rhamnose mutarotase [Pontibacter beigongshangensis]|uniref:L-rhamnose mutarotase n=1 Tax=Pontibacter beigongshangensis TaxID=2574733 RepID=UPI001650787E|nr:L-rhamnose mutarotase [Pontibacter beigongshangensis]